MKLFSLLACCSAMAFSVATAAAQTTPAASNEVPDSETGEAQSDGSAKSDGAVGNDILVTGSRVVADGYQAPTPVTVVGADELKDTSPNIADALRQLPQLGGSSGPSTVSFTPGGSVSNTASTANLRNLGITRTLVLLDGRRPPASGVTGTADISLFPLQLIKRVDIVTGGASAAYGSDAVAGVVNFVLDTKFRGIMAEARSGISSYGDGGSYNAEASAGFGFADDRGSLIVSGSIGAQNLVDGYARDWANLGWGTIPNPLFGQPGQPQLLQRPDNTLGIATFGGLIASGPLQNTQFDANGNPIPYNRGDLFTGTVQIGGDGVRYPVALVADVISRTAFAHADFEVSDNLTFFAEGGYGYSKTSNPLLAPFTLGASAYQIRLDNAFLPAATRQAMINNGLSVVPLSKIDMNFGRNKIDNITETLNLTAGFNLKLGGFTLDGYYEHGETRYSLITTNQRITARTRLALDAVVNPATNQIVCRSTLADPTNGCVPWNPFGEQPLTAQQRAYQEGSGFARSLAKQDVFALTLRGDLFSTWAGPVATAVGAEYRDMSGSIVVDPISRSVGFSATNPQPSAGRYDVKEAFGEVLVPLLRSDGFIQSINFNGAIRRTDYSTSGGVTTWKLGLTADIASGLLLRGTISRDIRAPNIGDLFGPRVRNIASVIDPFNGNRVTQNVFTFSGSNPDLLPERAKTIAAGLSYRPDFAPGLGFSIDYYNIKIDDAISTLTFQQIVNQCFAGNESLCSLITRNTAGVITDINGFGLNIASIEISGIDFDASYQTDVGSGRLSLRGIASYLHDLVSEAPGTAPIQQAGTGSTPRWRGNLQATYSIGGTTIAIQERFIAAHRLATPPQTISPDRVPAVFYTNLTIRQAIDAAGSTPELFLTINNLFNKTPPPSGTPTVSLGILRAWDQQLYDPLGRYITIGARIRF